MEDPQKNRSKGPTQTSEAYDLGIAGMRPHTRFILGKTQNFYGPGIHRLLYLTQETGSVLDACRQMGLSYSKGRKIIATAEQQLGFPLLERQQGGKGGGHSLVTAEAKTLMDRYDGFCAEAETAINDLFQKYF